MTAQILDRGLTCYRIGDPDGRFPILDATGSALAPGRWNTATTPLIYSSEHYSTALLEKLVRGRGRLPPNQHFITIEIPRGSTYEVFSAPALPGWDAQPPRISKIFGETWCLEARSLILIVPSVVARPERNILINPAHAEFSAIRTSLHERVHWDRRLFAPAWQ